MMDYEYIFAVNLHEKLKEKIIAHIYVKVDPDDTLYVKIKKYRDIEELAFEVKFDNFANRILNGWSTEYACYEIVKKYKSFIANRFFIFNKES